LAVKYVTSQIRQRNHCPDIPKATVTEKQFSRAFGGLREKPASSPSGIYNAHYMYLDSKMNDNTSNPTRKIQSQLMELPITHGFAPQRHLTRYDLVINKKSGNYISDKLRLVHGVKATENQTLKISVAWEIKRLVKQFDDIFYEYQFRRQHKTCLSAIILKQITVDSFKLTKTPGIVIDNDANGAFNQVILGSWPLEIVIRWGKPYFARLDEYHRKHKYPAM
jgi:hypothetical protein